MISMSTSTGSQTDLFDSESSLVKVLKSTVTDLTIKNEASRSRVEYERKMREFAINDSRQLMLKIGQLKTEAVELKAEIKKLISLLEDIQSDNEKMTATIENLKLKLQGCEKEVKLLKAQDILLNGKVDELKAEVLETNALLAKTEVDNLDLLREKQGLAEEINKKDDELKVLMEENKKLKEDLLKSNDSAKEKEEEMENLKSQVCGLKSEVISLKEEVAKPSICSQFHGLKTEVEKALASFEAGKGEATKALLSAMKKFEDDLKD